MKPIKLTIKTNSETYPIIIGSNIIKDLSKYLSNNLITFNQCLLVIDKKVPNKMVSKITKEIEKVENEAEDRVQDKSEVSLDEERPKQEGLTSELEDEISSVISSFSSGNDFASVKESSEVVEESKVDESFVENHQWNSVEFEEDNSLAAQLAKKRIESLNH